EAEAAAEAGPEFGIRDFAGPVIVIQIERVALVDQIINARAGVCVDGCAGHVGSELHSYKILVERFDDGWAAAREVRSVGEERRREALLEQRSAHEEIIALLRQIGLGEGECVARVERGVAITETAAAAPISVTGLGDDLHAPETRIGKLGRIDV